MTEEKQEILGEYVLGIATPEDRASVERQLAGSPGSLALHHELQDALGRWGADVPPSAKPSRDDSSVARTRARLLATISSVDRFRPFFSALAKLFALDLEAMRALLGRVDDSASYQVAPMPGVRYFHFSPGEKAGFAEAGIVRLAKGGRFPRHQHLGDEVNFVLEGVLNDSSGRSIGPGDAITQVAGSVHDYSAGTARDLILVAGHSGITYLP